MKRRKGFVTNSSSSSFVIYGFNLKMDLEELETNKQYEILQKFCGVKCDEINAYLAEHGCLDELLEERTEYYNQLGEYRIMDTDHGKIVGNQIARIADNRGDHAEEIDFDEIYKDVKHLQELLGTDETPKLFTGCRSC